MDTIILLLLLYYAASIVVSSAGRGVLSGRTAAVVRAVLELGIFICYLHTITIAAYTHTLPARDLFTTCTYTVITDVVAGFLLRPGATIFGLASFYTIAAVS